MPVVARVGADDGHQVLVLADMHDLDRLVHAILLAVAMVVDAIHLLDHGRQVAVGSTRPQGQRRDVGQVVVVAKRRAARLGRSWLAAGRSRRWSGTTLAAKWPGCLFFRPMQQVADLPRHRL